MSARRISSAVVLLLCLSWATLAPRPRAQTRPADSVVAISGATILTAFNDNAAITYLASLVPGLGPGLQYAVVAGAVVGGGLTVIANAPNPAGQSALARYFPQGVAPGGLLAGAFFPTAVMAACFLLL